MTIATEPYLDQLKRWPVSGRHILAHFDEMSVVVYQAYRPGIGRFAMENQQFGGEFSLNRMSWIKPNFLWMMYRSGWGTKLGQEVTLAVHLQRAAFEEILGLAIHSTYLPEVYGSPECWKVRLAESPVRLQWDPDHDPRGVKQERRAIQLGLAGNVLRRYAKEWILKIEDISDSSPNSIYAPKPTAFQAWLRLVNTFTRLGTRRLRPGWASITSNSHEPVNRLCHTRTNIPVPP